MLRRVALRCVAVVIISLYIMMNNDNAAAPTLTEPCVRYFLSKSLEQCHKVKDYYHTQKFNFIVAVAFFVCLGIFLYLRYKGKPTPEEVEAKKRQQQEYILSKLKMVNATHYAQSKVFRWMRAHTPRGMEWGCLQTFPYGKDPMKITGNATTRSVRGPRRRLTRIF